MSPSRRMPPPRPMMSVAIEARPKANGAGAGLDDGAADGGGKGPDAVMGLVSQMRDLCDQIEAAVQTEEAGEDEGQEAGGGGAGGGYGS